MSDLSLLIFLYLLYQLFVYLLPKTLDNYYSHKGQKYKGNESGSIINSYWFLSSIQSINPVTEGDKQYARDFPDSNYARLLASNPNYRIEKSDLKFISQSPLPLNSFVHLLLEKRNVLKIEPSAVEFLRKYKSRPLTCDFTSSPMYKVEYIDKEIARLYPYSYFALGIVLNVGYKIEPKDILIAKQNPESYFAMALEQKFNFKDKVEVHQDYV